MVDTLVARGVDRIYGVTGDSLNGIADSIRANGKIKWAPVRHEESAAFAAGAEAQLTGRLAVCAGTSGPGNLHLINGLYDCHRSRVPVLAIAAHIPSHEIGTDYFQETHPQHLFAECSHFCELVSSPSQMPRVLEIAIETAIAKRGVAVIVLPGDVALQEAPEVGLLHRFPPPMPTVVPNDSELRGLAAMLNQADRITILGGIGCADAHDELVALAGKLQAPIVHALRGKEFIEYDNPYDVGMTGLLGFASGYHAIKGCELLLMLGTDFPYTQFYPDDAKIVQVDVRGEQLGRRCKLDFGLVGDIRPTLRALIPLIEKKQDSAFLEKALKHYRESRKGLDELAEPGQSVVHPQYLTRVVDRAASQDAIFTCDVGTPTVWACRYLTMNGRRRLLGSFVHGTMASALPQAIGAQASHPDRQVISLSGDGGLAMLLGDLATLRQIELPIKVIVYRNDSLGFVELEMKAAGFLEFGVELKNPDFAKIAEAMGMLGLKAERPQDVQGAVEEALAYNGPALVEVKVNRQELSMPPTITRDQVVGFGIWMMKAVMSGRGTELIDLAKTNLFR